MADDVTESESTIQADVIKRIKVHLVWRDWSQIQLADAAGMHQAYLSRRMTGEILFDVVDLDQIAGALGVAVRDLLPGSDSGPPAVTVEPRVVTRGGQQRRSRVNER